MHRPRGTLAARAAAPRAAAAAPTHLHDEVYARLRPLVRGDQHKGVAQVGEDGDARAAALRLAHAHAVARGRQLGRKHHAVHVVLLCQQDVAEEPHVAFELQGRRRVGGPAWV